MNIPASQTLWSLETAGSDDTPLASKPKIPPMALAKFSVMSKVKMHAQFNSRCVCVCVRARARAKCHLIHFYLCTWVIVLLEI